MFYNVLCMSSGTCTHFQLAYFGQDAKVGCDEKCHKAWGINGRPKVQLSDDEDDYAYLSDDELEIAPIDPGTYEGGTIFNIFKELLL